MILLLRVEGDSMSPTLEDGQLLLALSTALRPVQGGRIVVFRRRGAHYIKRALTREAGGWFVVGDQPARSTDSRRFGPVPLTDIQAVAICRLGPFKWL